MLHVLHVVPLRAVSDVVGTHPEAKEHSVSRWLSRYMNVMKSHACNQNEESHSVCPTWGRIQHASEGRAQESERNSDCHGSGKAPAVRRHMTLDVAGVAAALLSTSRHSEKTEGRCQVLVTNVAINIVRTYEDCDCFAS